MSISKSLDPMKYLNWYIGILTLALGLASCNSETEETTTTVPSTIQVATGDLQDVTLTTATLLGAVTVSGTNLVEVGFACCLENSSDVTYTPATEAGNGSAHRNFSAIVRGLQPNATYNYYAYVKDANGNLIAANDQKSFQTMSPAELLKSNAMQWVAMHDATFSWTISDSRIYEELKTNQLQSSFGVVLSPDRDAVVPIDGQYGAPVRTLSFNQGQEATLRYNNLRTATVYYYTTFVTANGRQYDSAVKSFTTIDETAFAGNAPSGVQALDMGLPSGTKWANMNVGAETVTSPGLFFAWGEAQGYLQDGSDGHLFGWTSYKWCNGSRSSQTKYCTNGGYGNFDNKDILDLADDAAYINWGENWRMPTSEEMKELIDHTHSEWTTVDGVDGYLFTSKTTDNRIFLPAAGSRVSESNYENGTDCYFWTSTLDEDSPYAARYLRFYVDRVFLGSLFRYYGMNIRPVQRH